MADPALPDGLALSNGPAGHGAPAPGAIRALSAALRSHRSGDLTQVGARFFVLGTSRSGRFGLRCLDDDFSRPIEISVPRYLIDTFGDAAARDDASLARPGRASGARPVPDAPFPMGTAPSA
jgi:hypothetical protein